MTSIRQWLRTSRFLLFIPLGMSLFWKSCDNPLVSDTLPDQLDSTKAQVLINNFQNAQGDVGSDFYFDGDTTTLKVDSFSLNPNQTAKLFDELHSLEGLKKDSVLIRIHMAFHDKAGAKSKHWPNFVPLLQIIVNNKDGYKKKYYPLRPYKAEIEIGNIPIPKWEAKIFMHNWDTLYAKDIKKQLYTYDSSEVAKNRIQYFTFRADDVEDINKKYHSKAGKKSLPKFIVYLGQCSAKLGKNKEDVGLRFIVRVVDPSKSLELVDPGEFEFSRPCPTYCDTNIQVIKRVDPGNK